MSPKSYYPAFLDLEGRPALVVGGGAIAARKARALAACGARVTLVAPRVTAAARRHAHDAIERAFRPQDLRGTAIVVAATDEPGVNELVARLCREKGIWVNTVDRTPLCDFIVPAVVRRGRIVLAISTGAAAPGFARRLRQRLEKAVTAADARAVEKLARLRPSMRGLPMKERRKVVASVAGPAS